MPANVNFLNCLMATLGEEFDGSEDEGKGPLLHFREIPLFKDPSKLESGTCYVDIDEMDTPGAREGRTIPETFDFAVTVMPVWDIGKEFQDGEPPTLSHFRSIVEYMVATLKERSWPGTGIILEIYSQQMSIGDPTSPTHIAWEIAFHIDVHMDLAEVWYYPPNVTPVKIRSITSIVRVAEALD